MLSENIFIGQHLGGYRVIANISNGPMSSVYQAQHISPEHLTVAIKILQSAHLAEQRSNQFLKEVQLLKKLNHPHILSIRDAGIFEGMPYLVTEYARGGSLRNRITLSSASILPMHETLAILSQMGQALQYAHQFNFMHGNLKPENILFDEEGGALLADFSIVTTMDAFSAYYQANTLPYMAPERFQGWITKESDQYALGCIAYELVTGQVPFLASTFSEFKRKHEAEKPTAPTQLNLLLSISLENAILKAIEKKSEDRYPSIKDFVTSLATATSGRTRALSPVPTLGSRQRLLDTVAPSSPNPFGSPTINTSITKDVRSEPERIDSVNEGARPLLPILEPAQQYKLYKKPVLTHLPGNQNPEAAAATMTQVTAGAPLPLSSPVAPSGRRSGNSVYRQLWLILLSLPMIIVVIIYSLFHFALPSSPSPTASSTAISQNSLPTPTPTQRPAPTPTHGPGPKLTPTPTSFPALLPTAMPSPTPTPSPTPIPAFAVTPTSMQGETGCQKNNTYYVCTVTLQLSPSNQGNLKWNASANNLSAFFNPSKGVLSPGQQQPVTVYILMSCPTTGSLNFFSKAGTVSVQWAC